MGGRGKFDKVGTSWSVPRLRDEQNPEGGFSNDNDGGGELVLFGGNGDVEVSNASAAVEEPDGTQIAKRSSRELNSSGSRLEEEKSKEETPKQNRAENGLEEEKDEVRGRAATRPEARASWRALKSVGVVTVGGIALGHSSLPEINLGEDARGGLGIGE